MFLIRWLLAISLLSGMASATTVLHLDNGEDEIGDVTAVDRGTVVLVQSEKTRRFPLRMVVALTKDGALTNGPFEAAQLRKLVGLNETDENSIAQLAIRTEVTPKETPYFLKYGTVAHYTPMAFAGTPGNLSGGGSSFSTHFSRCYKVNGTDACNESQWIGLMGETLGGAVASVPEAKKEADRVFLTTSVQAASIVAIPVFLFTAISLADNSKDRNGDVRANPGPASITFFILTGAAFLNYAGWSFYEGVVVRRAIRLFNASVEVKATTNSEVGTMGLSYRF